ncbi:MAG: FHA domain-containing protein [Mogibacterium sp.]|nr:FHA domain-containing protein [Mogibacterium sp.]
MIETKRIRKRITGSLAFMIALIMIIMPQAALAASSHSEMNGLAEPQTVSDVDAATGVVRIVTGINDTNGKFKADHTFSGFVVGDTGNGGVYIVTTWHNVNHGQDAAIHVIVKNDTAVDALVESYSVEQDFCIISAGGLNGKTALPLRITEYDEEGDTLSEGAEVKALGFNSEAASGTEFSASDVKVNTGTIKSMALKKDSATYISHTADISGGLDGGPLVDEHGYVIGINNPKASGDDGSCALLIQEADKLLDSAGIQHQTKDKDALYGKLYKLCDQSIGTYKKVKKEYKDDFKDAIQNAIKVMGESRYNRKALQGAFSKLQTTLDTSELKPSKLLYLIIALGALIAFLVFKLVTLVIWNRRYEADNPGAAPQKKGKKNKPAEQKPVKEKKQKAAAKKPEKAAPVKATPAKAAPVKAAPDKVMPAAVLRPEPDNGNNENVPRAIVRRTGAVYELKKNIMTIGRSRDADICIEGNEYVAKMHAMIENRKGTYFIHDMGSINGTYLNGQRVTGNGIRLISGDLISVANEEITYI